MRAWALIALAAFVVAGSATAQQRETITFESRHKGKPIQLTADIYWPAAQGPVPAMVIHHGSGGYRYSREGRFAREMVEMGIAGVVIDSFKARDITLTSEDQSQVTRFDYIFDALGALKAVAGNQRIKRDRIGIMGFSKGGLSALYTAQERFIALAGLPAGLSYALHVPFYPLCPVHSYQPKTSGAPIYMLIGGSDSYVGVEPCTTYAELLRASGARVETKIYPGAPHGFDGPPNVYMQRAENPSKCVFQEKADGNFVERASGVAVPGVDGWPPETSAAFTKAFSGCRTFGAGLGPQAAAAAQSMVDLKSYVKRHLLEN